MSAPEISSEVVAATPATASTPSAFPLQAIAIFTAIAIFLGREGLEAKRRHDTRQRQLSVLKANLARQCEFNNWGYRSLKRSLEHVRSSLAGNDGDVHKLTFNRNGSIRLTTIRAERVNAGMMLPSVRVSEFESQLMQAADLDENLQKLTDAAAASSAEMLHVRDSLISHILNEDDEDRDDDLVVDFIRYGLAEIEDTYVALNRLYVYCTGEQLTNHRLR